jgi:hypothetical protein
MQLNPYRHPFPWQIAQAAQIMTVHPRRRPLAPRTNTALPSRP